MLYEVITPLIEGKQFVDDATTKNSNAIYQFDNNSNEDIDEFQRILDEELAHRITSYNVCYTKLLRSGATSTSSPLTISSASSGR